LEFLRRIKPSAAVAQAVRWKIVVKAIVSANGLRNDMVNDKLSFLEQFAFGYGGEIATAKMTMPVCFPPCIVTPFFGE